jgi:hypothetical protein
MSTSLKDFFASKNRQLPSEAYGILRTFFNNNETGFKKAMSEIWPMLRTSSLQVKHADKTPAEFATAIVCDYVAYQKQQLQRQTRLPVAFTPIPTTVAQVPTTTSGFTSASQLLRASNTTAAAAATALSTSAPTTAATAAPAAASANTATTSTATPLTPSAGIKRTHTVQLTTAPAPSTSRAVNVNNNNTSSSSSSPPALSME